MNKNDILKLNINSNAFEAMKDDFNTILRRTLGNMRVKESDEATLTVKLSITLEEIEIPDIDSPSSNGLRRIHKPSFTHKVSSVMQTKTETSGSLDGEFELVWDDDENDFVMKPIGSRQSSLFDDDYIDVDVSDEEQQTSGQALIGSGTESECDAETGYQYTEDSDE